VLRRKERLRLEEEGEMTNVKVQMEIWNNGMMEHWNNETMKSCNDGMNAQSPHGK
jgi:hypothetical protein